MDGVGAAIAQLGRSLEASADELIDRQIAVLQAHPSYADLRELDLRYSALRNVRRAVVTMGGGDVLDGPDYDSVTTTVKHVVPDLGPQDVVSAYRAAMGVIRDAFVEQAGRAGISGEITAAGLRLLWDLTDRYSDLLAAAHDTGGALGQRDRLRYLQRALRGQLAQRDLEFGAAALGLLPDVPVRVFRVAVGEHPRRSTLGHLERQALGWPAQPLLTLADAETEMAGLTSVRPAPLDEDCAVIAVSDPVPLIDLHRGFLQAGVVAETARRFGLVGVVDVANLGLRTAVLAVPQVSSDLLNRYVRDVESSTPMAADLLHTVATFLACERRFQRTAKELNMHVNSLRHRLERYQEITRANLADTETVVEVWWALQYRRALDSPS
jgi:PucR C-terminal helix-turn-helix domain